MEESSGSRGQEGGRKWQPPAAGGAKVGAKEMRAIQSNGQIWVSLFSVSTWDYVLPSERKTGASSKAA